MLAHDVQDDVVVAGIEVVAMIAPTARAEVQFDAAMLGGPVVDRDDGVPEVRPETVRP